RVFGPHLEARPLFALRVPDAGCRICRRVLRLYRPSEYAAHGIEEIAGLRWSMRATIAAGSDDICRDLSDRPVASRLNDMAEDVLALAPRCRSELRPRCGLAIARNQPSERANGGGALNLGLRRPCDCCAIFDVEVGRSKFGANANARAFADAH